MPKGSTTKFSPPSAVKEEPEPDLTRWTTISQRIANPEGEVTIGIVGKYTGLKDAYKSLIEALMHGGIANSVKVNLEWIESEVFEHEDPAPFLEGLNGHPRPRRLRPSRLRGQDPRGALRPRNARHPISASVSACRWR